MFHGDEIVPNRTIELPQVLTWTDFDDLQYVAFVTYRNENDADYREFTKKCNEHTPEEEITSKKYPIGTVDKGTIKERPFTTIEGIEAFAIYWSDIHVPITGPKIILWENQNKLKHTGLILVTMEAEATAHGFEHPVWKRTESNFQGMIDAGKRTIDDFLHNSNLN